MKVSGERQRHSSNKKQRCPSSCGANSGGKKPSDRAIIKARPHLTFVGSYSSLLLCYEDEKCMPVVKQYINTRPGIAYFRCEIITCQKPVLSKTLSHCAIIWLTYGEDSNSTKISIAGRKSSYSASIDDIEEYI